MARSAGRGAVAFARTWAVTGVVAAVALAVGALATQLASPVGVAASALGVALGAAAVLRPGRRGRAHHSGAGWSRCPACRSLARNEAALTRALPTARGARSSLAVVGLQRLHGPQGLRRSMQCDVLAGVADAAGVRPGRSGGAGDVELYALPGDRLVVLSSRPVEDVVAALEVLAERLNRSLPGGWLAAGVARCSGGVLAGAFAEAAAALRAAAAGRASVVAAAHTTGQHGTQPAWPQEVPADQASADAVRGLLSGAGGIAVAYQPIMDLATGALIGYEALMRPRGSRLDSPALAFEVAGRIGLAAALDRACRNAVLDDAPGLDMRRGQLLFVNVAPQVFVHPEFSPDELAAAVRGAGLVPARVVLEVREGAAVPPAELAGQAERLRNAGFRIALDDVGGSDSRLETLWRCRVDYLKVDEALTARAARDRSARAVFTSLCALAQQTGSTLVAEGVEDERLFRFVRGVHGRVLDPLTVHAGQGYHLGMPGPRPRPAPSEDGRASGATEPAASPGAG